VHLIPDRKNGINLIPSRYHWDQLDAKLIVLDINFLVRLEYENYVRRQPLLATYGHKVIPKAPTGKLIFTT
jgi:hypothetical protein